MVIGERMANSRTRHAGLRRCYSACCVRLNNVAKWEIIVISAGKWNTARGTLSRRSMKCSTPVGVLIVSTSYGHSTAIIHEVTTARGSHSRPDRSLVP
jgi:hypothetical protein